MIQVNEHEVIYFYGENKTDDKFYTIYVSPQIFNLRISDLEGVFVQDMNSRNYRDLGFFAPKHSFRKDKLEEVAKNLDGRFVKFKKK
jgi:hypothetical protein